MFYRLPILILLIPAILSCPADTTGILTISRTLYDAEGRAIVSVGPYAVGDEPVGTETVYDALGRVERTRRWANVEITLEDLYGTGGQIVVGRKVPQNRLAQNTWEGTPSGTLAWTAGGVQPAAGDELSYSRTEYDAAGRVYKTYTQNEDETEICITEYVYDAAGRQIQTITLPGTTDETVTETHYDGARRDSVVDARGFEEGADPADYTTSFVYDDLGRVITTVYPASIVDGDSTPVATYSHVGYDGLGRKAWETMGPTTASGQVGDEIPDSEIKSYIYDAAGRLIQVVLPVVDDPEDNPDMGETITPIYDYFYDNYGNMTGILDPKHRLTVFKFDHLGHQTHKYMPFALTSTQYDDLMNETETVYTLLAAATPAPACQQTWYDAYGRVDRVMDYKGQVTAYIYNTLGQLWQKKYYEFVDTTPADSENDNYPATPAEVFEYRYDALGRQTAVYKDTVLVQAFEYNAEGTLIRIESPEGVVNYDYSPVTGRKIRTWTGEAFAAAVSVTEYAYDDLGRLSSVTVVKHDGQTLGTPEVTDYEYDENGNRHAVTLANGVYTEYTYDTLNRLTNITHYQDDTKAAEISHFAYQLYADGMRATVDESLNEQRDVTYQYDALNRVIQEDSYTASNYGYTASYAYDLAGNRQSRTVEVTNAQGQSTLFTEYDYDPDTDRLLEERQCTSGPCAILPMSDDRRVFVYADSTGGFSYQFSDAFERFGQLQAFFFGLPSVWSRTLFMAAMAFIPVSIFAPVAPRLWCKIRRQPTRRRKTHLTLPQRCLCVFLAYVMLLCPGPLQELAYGEVQFANLTELTWGQDDTTITYGYDANGSLTSKVTSRGGSIIESRKYVYNLQNRLSAVIDTNNTPANEADDFLIAEYVYNPQGIRVEKTDYNGASPVQTQYLIDPANHTGYAQVLEESKYDLTVLSSPVLQKRITYTIGDDIIAQASTLSGVQYLLYDGHGSTRQLLNPDKSIQDSYSYDAYGILLGGNPTTSSPADTSLLYAGEQYDTHVGQYYLRDRYYDSLNGRFNQIDRYRGNINDPQSLHKYLYCHANPINGTDPSGREFSMTGLLVTAAISGLLSSTLVGAYGYAKGWSARQIAKAAGYAFLTGAVAGAFAYGAAAAIAAGAVAAGATAGEAAAVGWTTVGLIGGPSSVGLSIANLNEAVENGDDVDKTFAVVNLGLASFGFIASHWSAFNLAASATAAKIPQTTRNYNAGRAVEDDFVAMLRANGFEVVGQRVRVETPFGKWRELDIVVRDIKTDLNYGIEVKSSIGAFNRNDAAARQQFAADRWINEYGAVGIGNNKGLKIAGTCKILWRPGSQ